MPSKSTSQHRFMQAAAHDPAFAKRAGIAQRVAEEFIAADKAKASARPQVRATSSQDLTCLIAPAKPAATCCLAYKRVDPERPAR